MTASRRRSVRPLKALTSGALLVLLLAAQASAVDVNRIVLRVNERIFTLYDYELRKAERIRAIQGAELPPERMQELLTQAGEYVLRAMFEEMLLLSRADSLGILAAPEEVEEAIERAKQSFGIESEEDFEEALAQSGMTREKLWKQMEGNIQMQRLIGQEVRPRIELEEEDIRRYYQAHPEEFQLPVRLQLRELVVLDTGGLGAEEAAEIAGEARAGTLSEEKLAAYEEQGATTRWMDLGWIQPGDLDPDLEAAVIGLGAGDVSEPVAARGGLHVVQVVDRKEAELLDFAAVEDQIRAKESDRVFQEEMDDYLRELEEKSYIVSRPPPEAANFRVADTGDPEDPLALLGQPDEQE